MTATTFTEAVQTQTTIMLNIAKRLDERGYAVVVHHMNDDGRHEQFAYSYVLGGLTSFFREWGRANKHKAIIISVFPRRDTVSGQYLPPDQWRDHLDEIRRTGKVFDYPFKFSCRIPALARYRPIVAALDLICSKSRGRHGRGRSVQGTGILHVEVMTGAYVYNGDTKDAFEVFLRVLEMPQHRAILTGRA